MRKFGSVLGILLVFAMVIGLSACGKKQDRQTEGGKPKFKVAWSIYSGWMPWPHAQNSGVLKKWADANGVAIELVQMDYIPSVEAYVAGKVDAVVMTNMETLDMPGTSGVDSTVLLVGDYSNGNDAICVVGLDSVKDLKGQEVSLVELSVSHYLLARALEKNGMSESDVKVVNTSDSDIATAFLTKSAKQKSVVTWNPMVMQVAQAPGVKTVFTSADIPGEILDLMVVRTDVLQKYPGLGKALTGAWYETMEMMMRKGPETDAALAEMAKMSGCTLTEYKQQLMTTAMFYTPHSAHTYMMSKEMKTSMDFVRNFCYSHGLLGQGAKSADVVGVSYPDGTVQGDPNNVKMRFDATYTKLAMEGKLTR